MVALMTPSNALSRLELMSLMSPGMVEKFDINFLLVLNYLAMRREKPYSFLKARHYFLSD